MEEIVLHILTSVNSFDFDVASNCTLINSSWTAQKNLLNI